MSSEAGGQRSLRQRLQVAAAYKDKHAVIVPPLNAEEIFTAVNGRYSGAWELHEALLRH